MAFPGWGFFAVALIAGATISRGDTFSPLPSLPLGTRLPGLCWRQKSSVGRGSSFHSRIGHMEGTATGRILLALRGGEDGGGCCGGRAVGEEGNEPDTHGAASRECCGGAQQLGGVGVAPPGQEDGGKGVAGGWDPSSRSSDEETDDSVETRRDLLDEMVRQRLCAHHRRHPQQLFNERDPEPEQRFFLRTVGILMRRMASSNSSFARFPEDTLPPQTLAEVINDGLLSWDDSEEGGERAQRDLQASRDGPSTKVAPKEQGKSEPGARVQPTGDGIMSRVEPPAARASQGGLAEGDVWQVGVEGGVERALLAMYQRQDAVRQEARDAIRAKGGRRAKDMKGAGRRSGQGQHDNIPTGLDEW